MIEVKKQINNKPILNNMLWIWKPVNVIRINKICS